MRTTLFCTLSLLAMGAAAQAADDAATPAAGQRSRQSVEERFKLADTDKDGRISQAEYLAAATARAGGNAAAGTRRADLSSRLETRFKELDTNKDGFLSLDEYKAGVGNRNRTRRGATS